MTTSTYISRSPREHDGQNLPLLQEKALAAIQAYASDTWTDHNATDPGITLLEVLTFVISDLSYRLGFPIRDLMAWSEDKRDEATQPFWLAPDVFPSSAVTIKDYQRLLLDIPAVRCVTLTLDDQKRYVVTLDTHDRYDVTTDSKRLALAATVRQRFLKERNVNDDIAEVHFIAKHPIELKMGLAFKQLNDPLETITSVIRRLSEVVSPGIETYSLEALMDAGFTPDEIMQGPSTQNGFTLASDVGDVSFPEYLFASDLIDSLSDLSVIDEIKQLLFITSDSDEGDGTDEVHWKYQLPEGESPKSFSLNVPKTLAQLEVEIDGQAYPLSQTQIDAIVAALSSPLETEESVTSSELIDLDSYQEGKYRELKSYFSLQHEFPLFYKLIDDRLNGEINNSTLANIMQLKGFLTLFDQVLADEFAQLELLKSLLALPEQSAFKTLATLFDKMLASEALSLAEILAFWNAVDNLPCTYVSQPITDISGTQNLLGDYWSEYIIDGFQPLNEAPFDESQLERLNRGMAHLLSRYAETTLDANLLQYEGVLAFYLDALKRGRPSNTLSDSALMRNLVQLKQVVDKAVLLCDYPRLSRYRAGGFQYLLANPKKNFLTSLGHRILSFLGVKKTNTLPLSVTNREGLFVLEGTLLWSGETVDDEISDEFRRTVFFILPDWPTRFRNSHFQQLLENVIAAQTPLHLTAKALYLDRQTMNHFEQLYYGWLNAMIKCPFNVMVGDQRIGSEEAYTSQWLASLTQTMRAFLISPEDTSILPVDYNSVIGDSVINPDDEDISKNEFRVHYQPLDFLKERSAIGQSVINPDDHENVFNINIQTPNIIKESS